MQIIANKLKHADSFINTICARVLIIVHSSTIFIRAMHFGSQPAVGSKVL